MGEELPLVPMLVLVPACEKRLVKEALSQVALVTLTDGDTAEIRKTPLLTLLLLSPAPGQEARMEEGSIASLS